MNSARNADDFFSIKELEFKYGFPFSIEIKFEGISYLVKVLGKDIHGKYTMHNAVTMEFVGYANSDFQAKDIPFENGKKLCECGADTVGAGYHSSWCPKNS